MNFVRRWPVAVLIVWLAGCAAGPASSAAEPGAASSAPASTASPPSASAASPSASSEAPSLIVLADGVISTDDEEYRISFALDGQTAYFARGSGFFPQTRQATIKAQPLASNSAADEYHPSLTPDGATLYFVKRGTDGDLYETPWSGAGTGG